MAQRSYKKKPYRKRPYRKKRAAKQNQTSGLEGFGFVVLLLTAVLGYYTHDLVPIQFLPFYLVLGLVGSVIAVLLVASIYKMTLTVVRYLRSEREKMDWFTATEKVKHIQEMDDYEAEQYMIMLFQNLGYQASGTVRGPDGGIDGYLQKGPHQYLLQVKRYKDTNKVGVKDVREFAGVCAAKRNLSGGYFVTTSTLTQAAEAFAEEAGLFVWYKQELADAIDRAKS